MAFHYHWERLDRIADQEGVDIRTILWSNPTLPYTSLPYMPPNGFTIEVPAGSLNPDFSVLPSDLQALKDMLDSNNPPA